MEKILLLGAFLMAAVTVNAQQEQRSYIQSYNAGLCSSWSYMSSTGIGSTSGYVCSGYPLSASLAEARSVQSAIDLLENKILALEAQINVLEAKIAR